MKLLPMILAAAGAVVVLAPRSGGQCTYPYPAMQTLTPSVVEANSDFGISVDVDGDVVVIGARLEDAGGISNSGAAYVFENIGGVWSETARLTADDGDVNDYFGFDVAVSGDRIVVAAPYATVGGFNDAGAVYVFEKPGGTWTIATKVNAGDLAGSSLFGQNLALSGDRLVAARQGHVAVLEYLLGSWFQTFETQATDSSKLAEVDIEGDWFIMSHGSSFGSKLYQKTGAAWSFAGFFGGVAPSSNEPKVGISNSGTHIVVSGNQGRVYAMPGGNLVQTLATGFYTHVAVAGDSMASSNGSVFGLASGEQIMLLQSPQAPIAAGHELVAIGDPSASEARVYLIRDPFIHIGAGCPGDGGFAPELDLGECALIGGPVTLSISDGPGGSIALVHLGIGGADIPIGAGCSLFMSPVLPTAIFLPLFGTGAGNGQVQVTVTIPPTAVPASFMVQSFVQDPTTTIGFTSTNAVRMTIY